MSLIQTFLGELIAAKRLEKKWSQFTLAQRCGLHIKTIEKLEECQTWPRHRTLLALHQVLYVPEIAAYFEKRREKKDKTFLADYLRKLRKDNEFTATELALQSGLNLHYILKFEDGRVSYKEKHIEALAVVFHMDAVQFVAEAQNYSETLHSEILCV